MNTIQAIRWNRLLVVILFVFVMTGSSVAVAGDYCGGYASPGNPYQCCSNGGNCTWWAWRQAQYVWGINLPWFPGDSGNARNWATSAQNAGYMVLSTPAINTIAVSTTGATGYGHVAWVTKINTNGTIEVSEMNCDYGSGGFKLTTYYTSYFNGGFIYSSSSSYPSTCNCNGSDPVLTCRIASGQTYTCGGGKNSITLKDGFHAEQGSTVTLKP
ncbi:N-acetylmuramoyl-L-alanine amidase Sle1 [Candidatus Moduliflexus flocculans]|uniref:N-acetylmuramoyl-L-alanine amidase Sle1 n=1 Tax=Candidatus Moduliflexus flocculans TaxID=1499966 RepID=A0A0S6VTH2_9BACT|nr:N-acetylmuramoyl-L-alanine amidase Sle1 [Candidatus Moduliflexus flocculans]